VPYLTDVIVPLLKQAKLANNGFYSYLYQIPAIIKHRYYGAI